MMLCGISREYRRNSRVEAAAEYGRQPLLLETVLISPLPRILEMGLVLGLVVGRIEVVDPALETCVHDRQVLIRERNIDNNVGLETAEEFAQFRNAVGIDLRRLYTVTSDGRRYGIAL